jgi:PKD repeat protein
MKMKPLTPNPKSLILLLLTVTCTFLFADYRITRGPEIGEIYYIGPTATGEGIYHSTDFGETATCMDSTLNTNIGFMSISADLTQGVLYGSTMGEALYISYEYGQEGSWIFRTGGISLRLLSGRTDGHLYSGKTKHSEDYGDTFIYHTCQGYFGDQKASEIDVQEDVGYALVSEYGVIDSLWFLISYDDFESFEIQHSFNWYSVFDYSLSRGSEVGELFLMKSAHYGDGSMVRELWYSNDFGENWIFKNHLLSNKIVGGRQTGELYVLTDYRQLMGEIAHIYIYHSLDYGETFTVYHPFSYGEEPYYSDFTVNITEGVVPLTVQFNDLSSGDIQTWQWDFDLDGTVDSYEQNPEYTYQDTGLYSVQLWIYGDIYQDGYIKKSYIHVTSDSVSTDDYELEITKIEFSNYPNPFNPSTEIRFQISDFSEFSSTEIEIYNLKGQKVKTLYAFPNRSLETRSVVWDGTDRHNNRVSSGIYLYKLNNNESPIKKMILLK